MSMRFKWSRLGLPIAILVLAGLALPLAVAAHAELVTASPKDGDTVIGNPAEIHATYSENLNPDGSSLGLYDASNARVARGGVVSDGGPREMFIRALSPLAPGVYTVHSTTRSAQDGDIDRVEWSFTVTAPPLSATPETTPAPSTVQPSDNPTPAPSATAAPSPSPSTGAPPSSSGSDVILPIIAGLAIITIGAGVLLSRGRRGPTA